LLILTPHFRSWINLNGAILQAKQARLARAWYSARHADQTGKGHLTRAEFINACAEGMGVTKRAAKLLLAQGAGGWWNESAGRVWLISQLKIADRLGVKLGAAVDLPITALKRLKAFKAYLLASAFAGKPRTMSNHTMSRLFGSSRSTIKSWRKLSGVQAERQFAYTKEITEKTPIPYRERSVFAFDIDRDGRAEYLWQLSSRYSSPKLSAQRKRQSKLGRPFNRGRAQPNWLRRWYFDTQYSIARAMSRALPGQDFYLRRGHNAPLNGLLCEALVV
jgi:hypothetical protein